MGVRNIALLELYAPSRKYFFSFVLVSISILIIEFCHSYCSITVIIRDGAGDVVAFIKRDIMAGAFAGRIIRAAPGTFNIAGDIILGERVCRVGIYCDRVGCIGGRVTVDDARIECQKSAGETDIEVANNRIAAVVVQHFLDDGDGRSRIIVRDGAGDVIAFIERDGAAESGRTLGITGNGNKLVAGNGAFINGVRRIRSERVCGTRERRIVTDRQIEIIWQSIAAVVIGWVFVNIAAKGFTLPQEGLS
ncbi:MAG: hypothetical protein AAB547_02970 [Patescibacteria group bacterium]